MLVTLREPYRGALETGSAKKVCDEPATIAVDLYGRALARIQVGGRDKEARQDLEILLERLRDPEEAFFAGVARAGEEAGPALQRFHDVVQIELALLDVRSGKEINPAIVRLEQIAERHGPLDRVRGRARHIGGYGHFKSRRPSKATDCLLEALSIFRSHKDAWGLAQTRDTLGQVQQAAGQLHHAVHQYSLSLALKAVIGDRGGMAITLGSLGRTHMQAGRYADALECFELDLVLAEQLEDLRGRIKMHNDIGRAHLGHADAAAAVESLNRCLALASRDADVFFAHKDLAWAHILAGDLDTAQEHIESAETLLEGDKNKYFRAHLDAARGAWLEKRGEVTKALVLMEGAAEAFGDMGVPDDEIPMLVRTARLLGAEGEKVGAERALRRALRRARRDGYARYLAAIREAMEELSLVEGLGEESERFAPRGGETPPDGYTILQRLGQGAFGAVDRAYDPVRSEVVAIKRLRLKELYDVGDRENLMLSIRLELEAASRIRHPGVARIHALGRDSFDEPYLVQEYIEGPTLRRWMETHSPAGVDDLVPYLAWIAAALEALHGHGVIHRDLKPENVLVRSTDSRPVLVDFGIARIDSGTVNFEDDLITGTIEYMSPEQARGKKVTGKTDVYALGVIAYEWLTGERPIKAEGTTFHERIESVLSTKLVPIRRLKPDLPIPIAALVEGMLAKKTKQRLDAADVIAACEAFS